MRDKLEVHLHTNDSCNLKCIHCYNESGEKPICNMPESSRLLELIKYFCAEYEAEIHLEGGEIFLRTDLLRQMNCLPTEILQCITITTNGTICTDDSEIIEMLCRIHALRVSVEGHTDEQQRTVRGITLDKVVKNALFYMESGIPVWLRLTMTNLNAEHLLDETLPYYMRKGFHRFQVYEFQPVGRGERYGDLLTVEDTLFFSFLEKLVMWKKENREDDLQLKIMLPAARREAVLSYKSQLKSNRLTVSEIAMENGISIHADGSVFLCPWDNEENHCILNVYKNGMGHMEDRLKQGELKHSCYYCSAVSIVC